MIVVDYSLFRTKADIADVTCINSVLTKIGLPPMSTTEATVQEVQTAVDVSCSESI